MRLSELHCKEVICVGSGTRLGFVSDVLFQIPDGTVQALIVPGPCRVLGMFGRNEEYVIEWKCVRRIGPDIILVDASPEQCRAPRPRRVPTAKQS